MTSGWKISATACLCIVLFPPALSAERLGGSLEALQSHIQHEIAGKPGAFTDFQTGASVLVDANDRAHAASLMKVPVMMAAFELAIRGEIALDKPVLVEETFHSIIGGEPFTMAIDAASPLHSRKGKTMPLRDLIDAVITRSDNTATNLVIDQIAAGRVNDLIRRLGTRNTKILRGVKDS